MSQRAATVGVSDVSFVRSDEFPGALSTAGWRPVIDELADAGETTECLD